MHVDRKFTYPFLVVVDLVGLQRKDQEGHQIKLKKREKKGVAYGQFGLLEYRSIERRVAAAAQGTTLPTPPLPHRLYRRCKLDSLSVGHVEMRSNLSLHVSRRDQV